MIIIARKGQATTIAISDIFIIVSNQVVWIIFLVLNQQGPPISGFLFGSDQ